MCVCVCVCLQAFRVDKDGKLNKVNHGDVSSVFKGAGESLVR